MQVVDNLETSSLDDGDVIFADFVQPTDVAKVKVSSKFGARVDPLGKKSNDFHYGVDLVVPEGTKLFAVADGIVANAGFSKKSGNYIVMTHSHGYESRYAHCQKLLKKNGETFKKGDLVALSGRTGDVTGPHVHVGFKWGGKWLDPRVIYPWYG